MRPEEKDRPIRCFRVITSPNITIREFCTEASRVHEINYGQPLAIKKYSWAGGRLEGIPEKPEAVIPDSQQSAILGHEDEDQDNDTVQNGTPQSSAGVKRASYHIQKATEGGRSVSTSATSPMAGETQLPQSAKSNTPKNRSSRNAVSIYDDFGTDTEEPTSQQTNLSFKKSPVAGLPGSQKLAMSPLNNNRSASKAFQSTSTPKELPLTPKSRRREEEIRKSKESEEASKEAQTTTAKAADERRRESEREAVAAKAERIRREKSEERKAGEKQKQAAKRQKEEAALAAQRLKDEKEKLRKEIEEEDKRKAVEEESTKAEAVESSKRASNTPQGSGKGTPVNKRNTPGVILPRQSSTPHYPRGKKSSLKASRSSESMRSSSPAPKDTSLEAQMPLPPKSPRRVSFDLGEAVTPAKSLHKKILVETPKESTTPVASSRAPAQSQTPIPLPKTFKRPDRSATPIKQPPKPSAMNQPPLVAARAGSKARSATPKPIPPPVLQKNSTEPKILPKKTVTPEPRRTVASTPDRSIPAKEKTKSPVKPAEVPLPPSSDGSDSEDSDSEEEVAIKPEPNKSTSPQTLRAELNNIARSDEDVEMGENQSSPRESRSPVVFHSNAPSGDERKSQNELNQTSDSDSSSSEDDSSDEESTDDTTEKETDIKIKTEIKETQESSEDDSDNDNEERKDEDVEMPDAPAQRSSPELPSHTRRNLVSPVKTTNQLQGPSFSSPAKKPSIKPPTFSFGASLSSLNSQKAALFKPKPLPNGQFAKSKSQLSSQMFNKEFSESESEEDSDSDDSSDDDDIPIPASSQIIPPSGQGNSLVAQTAKKIKDAGSDSDSDSDSDSGDAAAMEQARRSLMAQLHQSGMSASQNSLPQSSQISVNGGVGKGKGGSVVLGKANRNTKSSRSAGKEFAKKGKDRITNGYDFKSYGSFN
ncbi:hypothetical protein EYC84_007171 [Monilinia fructicola]|uniref:Uncharacterized protein n=1 Tax=Monilinia fructicola TaxID=38448 RepID=A0A5M9KAA2_MONFR|nr:hypothetical protein EYC84_007171 [Monilinia fructicola]